MNLNFEINNNKQMKKQLKYYFNYIENCNMCGASNSTNKILGKRLNASQGKNPKNKIGITTTIVKCNNCNLIYSNPQPIPFSLQDHYGVPPEDYWKESYFVINEFYFLGEIQRLKSLIDFKVGMKSLDIGAGLGKAMTALANAGFDTYGIEPSKEFYERAISKMGISPERLKLGQIEEINYPQNTFDFISFGAVLEHLYDPSEAIQKAMGWLKANGIIHIEIPSSDWLINKIINLYYKINRSDYVGNLSPMHDPYHLYEFGLKSFKEHSKKYNYDLAFYQYYVGETFMPKIADYLLKPYMKRTNTGMQLCVWLRKK
jgi:ubiquinone/menaquinone biosynthesis C-methylase UbiE